MEQVFVISKDEIDDSLERTTLNLYPSLTKLLQNLFILVKVEI